VYKVVAETGPAHARIFTVEVRLGDVCSAQAEGSSKKSASQSAAKVISQQLAQVAENET
jgi:ribonuclease-3